MPFPIPTVQDPEVRAAFDRVALELERLAAHEFSGTGSPEGVVVGQIGDRYRRTDGSTSTSIYIKTADDGLDTGWTAK